MKKAKKVYQEDENGVLLVRAFMQIKECNFHAADKWWLLSKFRQWLEAQAEINRLYADKPADWVSNSLQWSSVKMSCMRNIVAFIKEQHAVQGDADSPSSSYYSFLDKLFGKGKWDEYGL